jgi:hypothetical protein
MLGKAADGKASNIMTEDWATTTEEPAGEVMLSIAGRNQARYSARFDDFAFVAVKRLCHQSLIFAKGDSFDQLTGTSFEIQKCRQRTGRSSFSNP